jgi:hypothetical protein
MWYDASSNDNLSVYSEFNNSREWLATTPCLLIDWPETVAIRHHLLFFEQTTFIN